MTTSTTTGTPTVTACVTLARDESQADRFLSQSRCVDWLLDCLNVTTRTAVREIVTESLATISNVKLVKTTAFHDCLDRIQVAFLVDQAFDSVEVAAS